MFPTLRKRDDPWAVWVSGDEFSIEEWLNSRECDYSERTISHHHRPHPASSLLEEGPSRSYSPVGCCLQMWVLSQAIVSCCCKLLFKIISLLSSELQPAHTMSILDIFNFHLCQIITKYFSSFLKKSLSNQVYLLNISDPQAETLWPRETILLLAQSICHISIFL